MRVYVLQERNLSSIMYAYRGTVNSNFCISNVDFLLLQKWLKFNKKAERYVYVHAILQPSKKSRKERMNTKKIYSCPKIHSFFIILFYSKYSIPPSITVKIIDQCFSTWIDSIGATATIHTKDTLYTDSHQKLT
jgi:hypothetical protein